MIRKLPRIRSDKKDDYLNYRLRNARKRLKYRLVDLEEITGIPSITLYAYESLRMIPDEARASKIAEALEKKVEYLFPKRLKAIAKDVRKERRKRKEVLNGQLKMPTELSLEELSKNSLAGSHNPENEYELKEFAEYALSFLDEKKMRILRIRYGFEQGPNTLWGIGKLYKITGERVRQIIDESLLKIREKIRIGE